MDSLKLIKIQRVFCTPLYSSYPTADTIIVGSYARRASAADPLDLVDKTRLSAPSPSVCCVVPASAGCLFTPNIASNIETAKRLFFLYLACCCPFASCCEASRRNFLNGKRLPFTSRPLSLSHLTPILKPKSQTKLSWHCLFIFFCPSPGPASTIVFLGQFNFRRVRPISTTTSFSFLKITLPPPPLIALYAEPQKRHTVKELA